MCGKPDIHGRGSRFTVFAGLFPLGVWCIRRRGSGCPGAGVPAAIDAGADPLGGAAFSAGALFILFSYRGCWLLSVLAASAGFIGDTGRIPTAVSGNSGVYSAVESVVLQADASGGTDACSCFGGSGAVVAYFGIPPPPPRPSKSVARDVPHRRTNTQLTRAGMSSADGAGALPLDPGQRALPSGLPRFFCKKIE